MESKKLDRFEEIQKLIRDLRTYIVYLQYLGIDSFPIDLTLSFIQRKINGCKKCVLSRNRKNIVFGKGDERALLMIIGEAPGEEEDEKGEPFVGSAGQLLTRMLESINIKREEVYITNIVKCRPPRNRNPLREEVNSCIEFLWEQIRCIKPKIILALGNVSAQTLLNTDSRISELRGKFYDIAGIKVLPSYHPAFLLRNPSKKREAWHDLKKLREEYEKLSRSRNI